MQRELKSMKIYSIYSIFLLKVLLTTISYINSNILIMRILYKECQVDPISIGGKYVWHISAALE